MLQLSRAADVFRQPMRRVRSHTGVLSGLSFLWLEITRSCNLTCGHCYVSSSPKLPLIERMGLEDWCGVMTEARFLGCQRMQFIGGEPTIHPDLPALIEHAYRVGFEFREVFTNATTLRDELVDVFKYFGVHVAFSFYSTDARIHDEITGQEGSFARTVDGVRRLADRGISLRAALIVSEETADSAAETQEYLKSLGVESIGTDRVRGIGRGTSLVPEARPETELCGYCWRGNLCVDAKGDAYPCVFSRFAPVGNYFSDGIKKIVKGRTLRAFRRRSFLNE